jgi:hypothetical protein
MKGFKFTHQTRIAALLFFSVYFLYGMVYIPFRQYLTCLAVGAIAYGISDSYEIATLCLFAMNIVFSSVCPSASASASGKEGFTDGSGNTLVAGSPANFFAAAAAPAQTKDIKGVVSKMSEGFEDAAEQDLTLANDSEYQAEETSDASVPADAAEEEETKPKAKNPKLRSGQDTKKGISDQGIPPAMQPQEEETFQDNGGLFKLGQIPKDVKGGFHIDAGTTVINALKSLKPDQIASMTNDTKQLIETQKSLMNMLNTFKPMMSEGKEMMNTFQQMFSPSSGATGMAGGATADAGKA